MRQYQVPGGRGFPTWCGVLGVVRGSGYDKRSAVKRIEVRPGDSRRPFRRDMTVLGNFPRGRARGERESYRLVWPPQVRSAPSVRCRASTTPGSRCVPARDAMWALTRSAGHALRYGRSWLSASQTSTAANARAASGISSPLSPRG